EWLQQPKSQTPNGSQQPAAPMPTDGVREYAMLYDEDLSDPQGRQYLGSVVWRAEPVNVAGKPHELAIRAEIEVPSRRLRMTLSFRRNLDPALPASHVVELTFRVPADFDGGGISNVPGFLMKVNQPA